MRGTTIIYAHPEVFNLLSEDCRRVTPTRTGLIERAYAAILVFTGKADALSWSELPNNGERP